MPSIGSDCVIPITGNEPPLPVVLRDFLPHCLLFCILRFQAAQLDQPCLFLSHRLLIGAPQCSLLLYRSCHDSCPPLLGAPLRPTLYNISTTRRIVEGNRCLFSLPLHFFSVAPALPANLPLSHGPIRTPAVPQSLPLLCRSVGSSGLRADRRRTAATRRHSAALGRMGCCCGGCPQGRGLTDRLKQPPQLLAAQQLAAAACCCGGRWQPPPAALAALPQAALPPSRGGGRLGRPQMRGPLFGKRHLPHLGKNSLLLWGIAAAGSSGVNAAAAAASRQGTRQGGSAEPPCGPR